MATVFLGNTSPREIPAGIQVHVNNEHVGGEAGKPVEGKTIVVIETPDHDSYGKKLGYGKKLLEVQNAFRIHSSDPTPAWVESHDEEFAQALADEYDIKVGRPDDWEPKQEQETPAEELREAAQSDESQSFLSKVGTFLDDQHESGELDAR